MRLAGNRYLNLALTTLIFFDAALILYIFLFGGVALRLGEAIPCIGNLKVSCTKQANPFLFLFFLLILKLFLVRPDPLGRFAQWGKRNRKTILLGFLVFTVAAFPRFWNLTGHTMGADTMLWVTNGKNLLYHIRRQEFKKATESLGHPGVVPAALIGTSYIYLGKRTSPASWNILDPIAAARIPGVVAGIATCLLLYLLGRIVLGDAVSFWGAILLSLSPSHIASSRIVQLDSTLTLFFTLTLLCYLIYSERQSSRWLILSAVFFGVGLLTKSPAYILPVILFAWKGCERLRRGRGEFRFWEPCDFAWLGIGLAIYFCLFTRLWYPTEELPWIRVMHKSPVAEILIGIINRVSCFPWLQITVGLLCVYGIFHTVGGGVRGKMPRIMLRRGLLALACLSFIQVFRRPMVNELLHFTAVIHLGEGGHIKYWMGGIVTKPPPWFYVFMVLVRTPPLMLALLFCGIIYSCRAVCRGAREASANLMCLLVPLIFITAMSLGAKMATRYIDPVLPFLCLLMGIGLVWILCILASLLKVKWTPLVNHILAGVFIAAFIIPPLWNISPTYDIYFNSLIGGPAGAASSISVGSGVGAKQAAEYLKVHAKEEDSIYALGIGGELRFYMEHLRPRTTRGARVNIKGFADSDWLVVPLAFKMRYPEADRLAWSYRRYRVHTITKCGVDFVDIYHVTK